MAEEKDPQQNPLDTEMENFDAQEPQAETLDANDPQQAENQAPKTPAENLASALAEANNWKDKYLRLSAEFDNYRKRTTKERLDLVKTAGKDMLVKLLPQMDNFERALKAMENATDVMPIKEGVQLIHANFKDFLKQNGLAEIDALNQDFDTDLHEALTKIPAPTPELKGKVVDVIEKGYLLNDKVVRYAKVVIGE